ncbi:3-demethylubiquinone-9 3-methyltransferase [Myxococcus hansupus]|uniref:3-demethylubiquinone-9 3-methyltransferase n=2 Tax=Pseudomyxococcus hansupus TaxID=1297742 RepID=A0A0H4X7A2_9BACT|nr:3-demethylubiquinone-9 3-methyltransferase [Myxococcus hansupus]
MHAMQKITPFLWFDGNAEEAVKFYVSVFKKGSKIISLHRAGDTDSAPLMSATFQLHGQQFMALNGGPHYKFTEAISLFVDCETQAEVDELWSKLLEGGGQTQQCGWLKDRFGLSWQIVPSVLGKLLGDKDPEKSRRVMEAMLGMVKLDIAGLQRAYDGTGT